MNVAAAVVAAILTITTQNVRVSLPPDQARHDIRQAAQHSSVVLTQEMGLRRARNFAPPGFGTAHSAGLRQGDCATYWRRSVWRERSSWVTRLTHAPFRAGTRYAETTILRLRGDPTVTMAVVCVHLITRSLARRVVYAHGIARLQVLLDRLDSRYPYVVVGGDWNRTWPRRAHLRGFRSAEPPAPTGTHGGRIDYLWWRHMAERGIRVLGHTFSDHQGVRMRLALRR